MRRAMRHAYLLGTDAALMHRLVPALVQQMGQAYPELVRARPLIEETLKLEETRFRQTLERGLRLLDDELARLPDGAALPGETAFQALRHLRLPARPDAGRAARKGSRRRRQRASTPRWASRSAKARAAWAGSGETADATIWFDIAERPA